MKIQLDALKFKEYLLFKDLSEKDINIFLEKITTNSFKKNDIIIKENKKGQSILFLIEGNISISQALTLKTNKYEHIDNREKELIRVDSSKSSFTFGEISLFNEDKKRTATVKATTDCIIGKLNFNDLFQICDSNHNLGYQIMKNIGTIVTAQLINSNNKVLKLTTAFSLMVDR